ncbi:hypothetical protein Tco_0190820 [Tanacetum coccineum]
MWYELILLRLVRRNRTEESNLCAPNATITMMGCVLPSALTVKGLAIWPVTVKSGLLLPTTTKELKGQIKEFSHALSVELRVISGVIAQICMLEQSINMSSQTVLKGWLGSTNSEVFNSQQANPKESHLIAVKRIFKYLKGTPSHDLWYPKCSCFDLKGYSDSDYAGCNMDRKSTSGASQFLGGKLMCLSAKKQQYVAMSLVKVEYVVSINYDNTSAIAISNNLVLHSRTKYIDIRYHILKGDIELHFIPTQYPLTDIFTKPLDEPTFKRLIVKLEQNPPQYEQPFIAVKQVSFNLKDILLNTNNEVALLYPEHTNKELFKCVSDFISKCCLREPFTKSPNMYKEYIAKFWYSTKVLENSKVSFSVPTGSIYGEIGVNTFRNAIVWGIVHYHGTLLKSLLPPRWSLANGINIDYASIFWEDIIIKLNRRHREKVLPYIRSLSLLMMHKMKEGYGDGEVTPYPTQLSQCSEATKCGSSKRPTGSNTGHLKRKKESSLAMDSNPSQTLASTPMVAEMHKEDQQATRGLLIPIE